MVNTPRIMKNLKRALPVAMAVVLGSTAASAHQKERCFWDRPIPNMQES